ncbi:unnamed protein product [Discosporangium mesarthrocarpum]
MGPGAMRAGELQLVLGALVESTCPLELLDLRGQWALGGLEDPGALHLAALLDKKATLASLAVGGLVMRSLHPSLGSLCASFWRPSGDRAGLAVDFSNTRLEGCGIETIAPGSPIVMPGSVVLRSCGATPSFFQGFLPMAGDPNYGLRRLDLCYR